jgi:hypothetical protein
VRPAADGSRSLDVLRGLAAVAMVFNHTGVAWLAAHDATAGLSGLLVFLGSMAPVLFFFATGVGIGLSPGRLQRPGGLQDLAWKATLLVVADQLLLMKDGIAPGLDFFGFIALSMVVVAWVDQQRRAVTWALALIAASLTLRYGLAPQLPSSWNAWWPLAYAGGYASAHGTAYPLSPWIVFPLAGYVLARWGVYPGDAGNSVSAGTMGASHWPAALWLAGVAAVATLAAAGLWWMGKGFHRWGSMNLPFFIAAVGVLAVSLWVADALSRRFVGAAEGLALRGAAAFIVVPAHYAMQSLAQAVAVLGVPGAGAGWAPAAYVAGSVAVTVLAFGAAKRLARLGAMGWAQQPAALLVGVVVCLVVASGVLTARATLAGFAAAILGQVLVAWLLGARGSHKRVAPTA